MNYSSFKSSFNGFLLFERDCFKVEGIFGVVRKDFDNVGWYSDRAIPNVDLSFNIGVEQVDDGFGRPVFKGHIVKDDTIVVWRYLFEFVDVGTEERVLEVR